MADTIQFDQFQPGNHPDCKAFEAMLTDAVDGALSPADHLWFDAHTAVCEHCSAMFADAQHGAAWLHMLKFPRPEPSADLLHKILAQTTQRVENLPGSQPSDFADPVQIFEDPAHVFEFPDHFEQPASWATDVFVPPLPVELPPHPYRAPLIPFPPRTSTSPAWLPSFNRAPFEPRLAMTAAMAFFSIALTLNLTGVRLDRIRVADLNPSTLRRSFYEAKGDAARRYDSLRVVHVLESRVDDLKAAGVQIDLNKSAPDDQPRQAPDNQPQAAPDDRTATPDKTRPSSSNQQPNATDPGRTQAAVPDSHPVLLPASGQLLPATNPAQAIDTIEQKWGRA